MSQWIAVGVIVCLVAPFIIGAHLARRAQTTKIRRYADIDTMRSQAAAVRGGATPERDGAA